MTHGIDGAVNRGSMNDFAGLANWNWVLASGNPGKARELTALLTPLRVSLTPQSAFGLGDADEPFATFVENALAKARHAAKGAGLPALADDSGICVPALGGAPGVHSARYAGSAPGLPRHAADEANNQRLIQETASLPQPVGCYYCCVIVLLRHPDDPLPLIVDGTWPGVLVAEPRGRHGFGYDPHFLPFGQVLTAAEMDPVAKNRVSHRGRAMAALLASLAAPAVSVSTDTSGASSAQGD